MSDADDAIGYLLAGTAGGVFLFFKGFRLRSQRKMIESIPTSKVRSIALGLVEATGWAVPFGTPLSSPFCGADCVYYRYKVEELRGSGKSRHWVTLLAGESPEPFFLEDETGKVQVVPAGATLHLETDRRYSTGGFGEGREELLAGLRRLGMNGAMVGLRTLRCSETYIMPSEPVYVMGTAQTDPARTMTERDVDAIMIGKGSRGFFCISDRSEKDLLGSLGWRMTLMLYGGPALTVGCLYLLVRYYGFFR